MGSSKKHKTKEKAAVGAEEETASAPARHREHKKHRHREKERRKRSRSPRERGRGGNGAGERRNRSGEEAGVGERRVKRERLDPGYQDVPGPKSASGDASLSIEETNKLRAKLGLKPLEVNTVKNESGSKEDPVAADVINPIVLKQQQELREKLAAAKEKRLLNQKLGKVKSLGEDELWLDDTAAWIERSRMLQLEREMADKRAKLLEEMEEEFGISGLMKEEFRHAKERRYTSKDLQGLTVEHNRDSFREGETIILTLKDKGVLDEDDSDVLLNVNLVDNEKARRNVELKKKKPEYKPYEEEESVDDMAIFKQKTILSKYDEEIDGEKKKSFKLDSGGVADGSWEKELQSIRDALWKQAQTLDMPQLRQASEYYTPEEMVSFKKMRRRVKRIRKKEKKVVKAEDLLPFCNDITDEDFGSRHRGRGRRRLPEEEQEEKEAASVAFWEKLAQSDDMRVENMEISDEDEVGERNSPLTLEEDEAELELQKQLERGRKLKQTKHLKDSGEKVLHMVRRLDTRTNRDEDDNDPERKGNIVFNATSEFCRTLGEIPTYGLAGNREDQEDLMDFEHEEDRTSEQDVESDQEENLGWSTVNLDEEKQQQDFSTSSTTILDEEPIVNRGLAAALLLCQNKGESAETTVQKVARVRHPNKTLLSAVYCIEDKMAIDDKFSRREEYRGFTQEFKEKDSYKPDVKIEYVDETGRKLTQKEAFRQLSHRFHGKGSGKMKTERRMKKLDEEALLKKMSSSDTPLGTVALLQEKQKAQKTPYIVLSGSGKSMNANTITK
ncbi:U4/U6.U5 tri-snRNP-associated protein 1 [Microcaecilia unicolor]|uniref:U4/U6.U5 tri-snRNP-associated protein 1 n=1 Tax=Microcaecilia unicolor TaxID=1415580 RepID=A0A6P7ZHU1_9AMPH|nr:U4/U6.U5 tri-snRNP-associated protein 1 [Microcaecilia unicolor]